MLTDRAALEQVLCEVGCLGRGADGVEGDAIEERVDDPMGWFHLAPTGGQRPGPREPPGVEGVDRIEEIEDGAALVIADKGLEVRLIRIIEDLREGKAYRTAE